MGVVGLLIGAGSAAQPVYQVTDQDGNVSFTDTPRITDGAQVETHTVGPTNTAQAVSAGPQRVEASKTEEPIRYHTRIITPADKTTVPMGPGNFTVEASVSPAIQGDDTLSLTLDGKPVGAPQRMPIWQLINVYRGEHQLQVVRLNGAGSPLDTSEQRTVYVMRPTVSR